MRGFAQRAALASLSFFVLSLGTGAPAQTTKTEDAPPATKKKPVDVFNKIEGESAVIKLKPAGTVVKKGEWVIEFDSSELQDSLASQQIRLKMAEGEYRHAKVAREVAEIGVKEFDDGISKEDIEAADSAIAQATKARVGAEESLKTAKSPENQLALTEAQIDEVKAKAKKAILIKYTEAKDRKMLESEIFKAKAEELEREGAWQREKSRADMLQREIDGCKIVSPMDGTVGYLRPAEVEDTFKQGEVLFRIFPKTTPK